MNSLIRVLDVVLCILVIVSLNLVSRSYKIWLLYSASSLLQVFVCAYKQMPGMAVMGAVLFLTGIKNYLQGRKKFSGK